VRRIVGEHRVDRIRQARDVAERVLIDWFARDLRQRGENCRIAGRVAAGLGQQKGAIAKLAEIEDEDGIILLAGCEQLASPARL
jgi:hypothetical protein